VQFAASEQVLDPKTKDPPDSGGNSYDEGVLCTCFLKLCLQCGGDETSQLRIPAIVIAQSGGS